MAQVEIMEPDGRDGGVGHSGLSHLRHGRSRASVRGVAWSLASVLVGTGISTVVFILTSRALSPSDFGLVALALSVVTLTSCIIPFGFGEALVQRATLRPAHLDAVFWTCGLGGAATYALILLNADRMAQWAGEPSLAPVLMLIGIRIPLDSLTVVPGVLLNRRMNYRVFAIRTAIANVLGGGICLGLIWAGYGFWALAVAQVVGSTVNFLVVTVACGWRPGFTFETQALRELRLFGLSASGTRVIHEMRLDQILLGALGGPAVLGAYFFARRVFEVLNGLTVGVFTPVTSVLFASLQDEPEKARRAFLMAGFAATLVGLPVFGGLIIVADTGLPLIFGPQWHEAVLAVRAFSGIGLMSVLGIVQATLINGRGHAGWWLGYQSVSQFSAVAIVLVVYPLAGFDAVMVAMVLRTVILWPLSVRKTLRLLDLPFRSYLASLVGPVVAVLVMAAAVEAVPALWPDLTGWALLGAQVGIGAVTYAAVAWLVARGRIVEIASAARRRGGTAS